MRKRKSTKRILAFILCLLMAFCSINLSALEVQASNDTTIIIDVTDLATGEETSHECSKYLTTKYDTEKHWRECSVCGKVIGSKTNHTLARTNYNYGYASCYPANTYIVYCEDNCGYSYKTCDPHPGTTDWYCVDNLWKHVKACSAHCGSWVAGESCHKADGSIITCSNLGTCVVCGHTYTKENSCHQATKGGTCKVCGKQLIDYTYYCCAPLSLTYN